MSHGTHGIDLTLREEKAKIFPGQHRSRKRYSSDLQRRLALIPFDKLYSLKPSSPGVPVERCAQPAGCYLVEVPVAERTHRRETNRRLLLG